MYVMNSGKIIQLRDCVSPTSAPTSFPTSFPTSVCTSSPESVIPKKPKRHWTYWIKWLAIFVVVAALFYYMCAEQRVKRVSFPRHSRVYRFYTR